MPVVAPWGTVVVIAEFETTVNVPAVPLKVTLVAAFQVSSQDNDGRTHFARRGHGFHERTQADRYAEGRASRISAAIGGGPIEVPIGGLEEAAYRIGAISDIETVQGCQHASRGDPAVPPKPAVP